MKLDRYELKAEKSFKNKLNKANEVLRTVRFPKPVKHPRKIVLAFPVY